MTKAEAAQTQGTDAPVEQETVHRTRPGDWAIAAATLTFFVAAYFLAQDWPFRAALFPIGVAVAGAALALLKLLALALQAFGGRRRAQGAGVVPSARAADMPVQPLDSSPESGDIRTAAVAGEEQKATEPGAARPDVQLVDDDQEEDQSLEYVFASAGGRAWASALAWIATFFVSFFVLGAFLTVPLFAVLYLRFSGKTSWLASVIYAVITGAIIFVVFREVVYIPLPESIFPFLDF